MKYGTAANRLRKSLLFKYVKLADHHICYRCGKEMESADEISIDHKKMWLYEDPALFWDLDNIAFSHMRCNKQDRPYTKARGNNGTISQRKVRSDKLWCNKCKKFLEKKYFSNNKYTWNGKQKWCKKCKSIHNKVVYRNSKSLK